MDKRDLATALEALISELKRVGKQETASFFQENFESIFGNNIDKRRQALERLASCASIAQYGNFTPDQERRLHKIVQISIYMQSHRIG